MVGKWLVVLSLLLDFNKVNLQPITADDAAPGELQLGSRDCCPCPEATEVGPRATAHDDFPSAECPCRRRADDAEASASIFRPALRAMQPFVTQPDQKNDPKPLLQPEVGLASSVLETLRQVTDEEYHEALIRDAAKSAVKLIESSLDPLDDAPIETPKNKLRIFLNPQGDEMDDNLPEPSHIQETRCIHSPLQSIYKNGQLRMSRPPPVIEVVELPRQPKRKPKNKGITHRNFRDMDNGIGASNIQEHIMQPDRDNNLEEIRDVKSSPTSIGLFELNNLRKLENLNGLGNHLNNALDLNKKHKQNLHLKLRELIDNLQIKSNKENSKTSDINLKIYIPTTTRMPPLAKINSEEKSIYNKRPLRLKDLLKLKDVELVPRNSQTQNTALEKSSYPNLKLQSDLNSDIDKCEQGSNVMTVINKNDITTTINPMYLDIPDIETSPTNIKPSFESIGNEVNRNPKQNSIPSECVATPEYNTDVISGTSIPTDSKNKDNFDYIELKDENESGYCNVPTGNSASQHDINTQTEESNNKDSQKGQVKKLENNEDMIDESPENETFQIELIEDLDTPVKFDNDSFNSESNLEFNDNTQHSLNNENTLRDPVAESSNNLQTENQINYSPNLSQSDINKIVGECDSFENTYYISENPNSEEKNQELTQKSSYEDNMNVIMNGRDSSPDVNENLSPVTLEDLQNMSNSILSLSDCDLPRHVNTKNDVKNENDKLNTAISEPILDTNSQQMEDSSDAESNLSENKQPNMVFGMNSNEKLRELSRSIESPSNDNQTNSKINIKSGEDSREMRAEASVINSKLFNPKKSLLPSIADSDQKGMIFSKSTPRTNDIVKIDKNKNFLENLKFKLADLFSTTEKVITGEVKKSLDDNGSESSNIKPTYENFNTKQRTPNTLLRESAPLRLPVLSLNNLAFPKHVNQPETSNFPNTLLPLDIPRPFEDPSLSFAALSDRLRSHTENTIQNVKETFESTLKDSQTFRLSNPTDTIDTHDIIESLSNRHDEMKEKLEAIHSDFNDRFSSFQQSILDHFNVQQEGISRPHKDNTSGGHRTSYKPSRKYVTHPKPSIYQSRKLEHDFVPPHLNIPKQRKNTEINLPSPKIPTFSEASRSRISKGKPSMQTPILYSTTTAVPSFIPRSKVLKTNIDSIPKLSGESGSKVKPSRISMLADEKVPKNKPLLLKPERTTLSKEPHTSPSSSSRINLPIKSFNTNTENMNEDDSPVNKFKKTLSKLNENREHRNELKKTHQSLERHKSLDNKGHSSTNLESLLSRTKIGRPRIGSRNNDELIVSPTSHMDTIHPSQDQAGLRMVEPLKENVPYKCKLICYKDS